MPRYAKAAGDPPRRQPPAMTLEERENQLVAKAVNLAAKQLDEGTASSQVITHYLKRSSTISRLEEDKLRLENDLLKAKTESLQSAKRIEELYKNAISAMRAYSGQDNDDSESNDYDYD